MKKVIFSIIVFFMVTICFVGKVSADTTKCYYRSTKGSIGSFDFAELTIDGNNAKLSFTNLKGPKLKCSKAQDAARIGAIIASSIYRTNFGIFGRLIGNGIQNSVNNNTQNACGFNTNRLSTNDVKEYSEKARNKSVGTTLKYIDANKNSQKVKLPSYNFDSGSCPTYVGAVINDTGSSSNVQVFAGDNNTKNFIDNYINNNGEYNYSVWGTKAEVLGKNPNEVEEKEETEIDSCEGLLGKKTGDEYDEGTVGYLLQQIFNYMKMAVVILVFAFSLIDYAKAIAAQDSEVFKKANVNFLKRIVFGIVFFLIPELVDIILGIIDSSACGIR